MSVLATSSLFPVSSHWDQSYPSFQPNTSKCLIFGMYWMMHVRDKKYYLLSQFSDISFVNLEYRNESVNSFSYDSDVICSNPLQKV